MREQLLDDVAARRFLLGQLPLEEQGRVEELAFADPDTFTFLESIEDDLIDEFIQGELSREEKLSFESHFLSQSGHRSNLKVSRLLQRHLDNIPAVPQRKRVSFLDWFKLQRPWLKISVTAVATLFLVIVVLWVIALFSQARKPTVIQAGPDQPTAVPNPWFHGSPSLTPNPSPAHVENKPKGLAPERKKALSAYALLSPSAAPRSDGVQQLAVARDTPTMTLELALITQKNFKTHDAALENEKGEVLQRWTNLTAENLTSGRALKIDVPTALLKPQEFYRIVVTGVSKGETDVVARYPFEVSK